MSSIEAERETKEREQKRSQWWLNCSNKRSIRKREECLIILTVYDFCMNFK